MNKEEFPEDYYEQLAYIIDKLEKIADGIRQLERRVRFAQISARKKIPRIISADGMTRSNTFQT